jgi:hypothetical protein
MKINSTAATETVAAKKPATAAMRGFSQGIHSRIDLKKPAWHNAHNGPSYPILHSIFVAPLSGQPRDQRCTIHKGVQNYRLIVQSINTCTVLSALTVVDAGVQPSFACNGVYNRDVVPHATLIYDTGEIYESKMKRSPRYPASIMYVSCTSQVL